jgi:hypothetical protein
MYLVVKSVLLLPAQKFEVLGYTITWISQVLMAADFLRDVYSICKKSEFKIVGFNCSYPNSQK